MASLNVLVVGAGIAGLTCSIATAQHENVKVTVLERANTFSVVGNGIQVPCNSAHAMRRLGVLRKLEEKSKLSATASLHLDFEDGQVILNRDLTQCERLYGAPWLLVHRADYMDVLLKEAQRLGVEIEFGCDVRDVDFEKSSVTLADGRVYGADVVVGSDGINSNVRRLIYPAAEAVASGSCAYRALFTASQLSTPLLESLTSTAGVSRLWMGPKANAVFYPVQDGKLFNLVLAISDEDFNDKCDKLQDDASLLANVSDFLRGWDPVLRELTQVATSLVRFLMMELKPLPSWVKGQVVLMGDAAHAMLPHFAQGAAMAVEDGVMLGTMLGMLAETGVAKEGKATLQNKVRAVLDSYASIQQPRASLVASQSRFLGTLEHLPRGQGQRGRDAEFRAFDPEKCVSAIGWIDSRANKELLGRKVDEDAREEFERLVREGYV